MGHGVGHCPGAILGLPSGCENLAGAVALLPISTVPRCPQSPSLACNGVVGQATRSDRDAALAHTTHTTAFTKFTALQWAAQPSRHEQDEGCTAVHARLPHFKAKTQQPNTTQSNTSNTYIRGLILICGPRPFSANSLSSWDLLVGCTRLT